VRRWCFFGYGVLCHLLFFATFAYLAGFVGNGPVPKSIDTPATVTPAAALLADLALLGLFGVQHSVMARPWFKRRWTRLVPEPVERSTYVLVSSAVTFLLVWQWQGLDAVG
jgi:protein-S-isoprenylcysteine O-methyltransferase Ste14